MFVVRLLVLMILAAIGLAMGQIPVNQISDIGTVLAFSFFITGPALYLLPTFEAWLNKHPNLTAIALLNVFLGWSVLGWVAALVWAYKKPEPTVVQTVHTGLSTPSVQPVRETKTCKFCAEEILAAAIKCKHCGSDVAA